MLTKCETLMIETKFEIEIEYSFSRVIITIAIDEQLNELATIKVAKVKIII